MKKKFLSALLCLCVTASLAVPAAASYLPDVTQEMSSASYWTEELSGARDVLMTQSEIAAYNRATVNTPGIVVADLTALAERFDAAEKNASMVETARENAAYYLGWTWLGTNEKATQEDFDVLIANCNDPTAKGQKSVRWGVAVNRTILLTFPSDTPIWDDPADADFDYQSLSAIRVNEPLVIYTTSADGKYYCVRTDTCLGWVAAEDVAICRDKAEWRAAWDIPSDEVLVITAAQVRTGNSRSNPDTSCRLLTQGTSLRLIPEKDITGLIANRSPLHSCAVYLPARAEDGSYYAAQALIPEKAGVHAGYLPLTQENLVSLALENLGEPYGWGGMLESQDCSGMIGAMYRCFGMTLARNTTWQSQMPGAKIDMTYMSDEERIAMLEALPVGATLFISGHEMFYLGARDGKFYVVSSVSNIVFPDENHQKLRVRSVAISTLDVLRTNGKNWMQSLTAATMPAWGTGTSHAMPAYAWYHDGVAYALENKLMDTREDGTFGISEKMTRLDVVKALWRAAGSPEAEGTLTFTDVPEADVPAVLWAVSAGVTTGVNDTTFAPDKNVSREQFAAFLYRAAAAEPVSEASLAAFRDAGTVSSYAMPAMLWACGNGLITGTSADTLSPAAGCTRAQAAVILMRQAALTQAD